MGLVTIGLAAGGVGVYAAILHVILHAFVKPTLFFQYNQLYWVYQSKSINNLGNYFAFNKTGALLFLLALFSVTALPPSGLFVSEFLIFQSLFEGHNLLLLVFVLILLTTILWGFGSAIFKLLFAPAEIETGVKAPRISPWESFSQYFLLAASVYLAYNPPAALVDLMHDAVTLIH